MRGVLLSAVLALTSCGNLPADSDPVRHTLEGATTHRVEDARILDPHFYADPIFIGCTDVTNEAPAGKKSANEQLAEAIQTDDDRDDLLDFAVMLRVPDPGEESDLEGLEILRGHCPEDRPNECQFDPFLWPETAAIETNDSDVCYEPDPELLSSAEYLPPVRAVEAPCFGAEPVDFMVDLGDSPFLLRDARFSATYRDDGKLDGMLVGFLTREEAERVEVKKTPLVEYLPGGDDVCAPQDDTDVGPDGGDGWWMHIDFVATPVEIIEPASSSAGGGCATTARSSGWTWLAIVVALLALRVAHRARPHA